MGKQLILGGPGCGKTTRLLEIVGTHLAAGIRPQQIAYIAFTKKAASEAQTRARNLFNLTEKEVPYFRTLHSLAFRELGLRNEQLMTSAHYNELGSILKIEFGKVEDELGTMNEQRERGSQYYHIEQQSRLRCIDLRSMCLKDRRQGILGVQHYQDSLKAFKAARHIYDYTDILELWLHRMIPLPVQVLIVDEAQDLSPLQWRLVEGMEKGVPHIYYAGDDDQAIYEWAGADISHFLNLSVPSSVLPISHRLPRQIFLRCDKIAKKIRNRYSKDWQPANREGEVLTVASPECAPIGNDSWMVLARNHYQLENVAAFLKSRGHVFTYSGRSSLARTDALAVRAWLRAQEEEYVSLANVKSIFPRMYKSKVKGDKAALLRMPNEAVLPRDQLLNLYGIDLSESWQENLLLRSEEKAYLKMVLSRGIDLEREPIIKVSTIHAVKGAEADNVIVLPDMSGACYESFLTKPDAEARVFYVACSRAKQRLLICHPQGANSFPL